MSKQHTDDEIIGFVKSKIHDMSNFYKEPFLNYKGKTSNTKRYYTEVISEFLVNKSIVFDEISKITRASSYFEFEHNPQENNNSNRKEERLAKQLKQQEYIKGIGYIIDYQVPLKNVNTDHAGKIDLLAYDNENNSVTMLELKGPISGETLLRALIEVYTYLKTVDKVKLFKDIKLKEGNIPFTINDKTKLKAAPLLVKNTNNNPYKEWMDIKNRSWTKKLIDILDLNPIIINDSSPF